MLLSLLILAACLPFSKPVIRKISASLFNFTLFSQTRAVQGDEQAYDYRTHENSYNQQQFKSWGTKVVQHINTSARIRHTNVSIGTLESDKGPLAHLNNNENSGTELAEIYQEDSSSIELRDINIKKISKGELT